MKLELTAQFTPNHENVVALLHNYGLQLVSFEPAKSGIENCTLFIKANSGNFVARIYRQNRKKKDGIQLEIDFITYLHRNSMPVVVPIPNKTGSPISEVVYEARTWSAILMPHIPGSHAKHYTSQLLSELAISHAKMHVLATNFTYKPQNIPDYYELREEYFVRLISDRDKLQAGFVDRAEAYTVRLERGLPSGLCHLDYGNDNILVKDGHIAAILDFDDLQYSPLIKCLAYTLWEVTFYNGPLAMEEYLLAYEILRKLSDEEKSLIKPCILFRHYTIGCLHMARGSMDDQLMERYLTLEQQLLQSLAK